MAHYSIKELEQLSGIKAHTIRIWEQRYKILKPERTPTNIRLYSDTDLKTLLNVALLNDKGYKISRIAAMAPAQLSEEVLAVTSESTDKDVQVNALLIATIEMHEEKIERIIGTAVLQFGFEDCMLKVIYPFMQKLGFMWQTDKVCPAHEHFVFNIIRQKLIVAIDGQPIPSRETAPRYLLFLPEGELHELTLLFMHYLLRKRGCHVMYLGQSLPLQDLVTAQAHYQAQNLLTVFTSVPEDQIFKEYLQKLIAEFREIPVSIYGLYVNPALLLPYRNIKKLQNIQEFISEISLI